MDLQGLKPVVKLALFGDFFTEMPRRRLLKSAALFRQPCSPALG